jgi:hypothetical protein
VEAGHPLDPEPGEDAALEHRAGPLAGLLGGLEEQDVAAGQVGRARRQHLGGAEQGGGVSVVAAGVHHPGDAGAEGEARLLLDGEGVDVGAEQHRSPRPAALQAEHRPGGGGTAQLLEPERAQPLADDRRGADLLAGQLGLGVEGAAQVDGLVEDGVDLRAELPRVSRRR